MNSRDQEKLNWYPQSVFGELNGSDNYITDVTWKSKPMPNKRHLNLFYWTPASSTYQNILFSRSNHLTLFKCRQIIIRLTINSIVVFSFLQFDLNVISANSLILRLFVSNAFLENGRSSMLQIIAEFYNDQQVGWMMMADEGKVCLWLLF